MKENNKSKEEKSIDQLLAEYQELENSVKVNKKPSESKILDKKAAEIHELEDSIK